MIHFNNAGASLPPQEVIDAQLDYLREEAEVGGYRLARVRSAEINDYYPAAAEALGAKERNMAWATSATDAFKAAMSSMDWKAGDVILTTRSDYVSNQLAFLQLRNRYGVKVEWLPDIDSGFDPAALEARLKNGPRPRLLSVTHVPTNRGIAQDIEMAGRLARAYEICYLVDACQSFGQLPLNVKQIGCDFLCATSRKYLRGPRGGGLLYVSDRVLDDGLTPLGIDLHSAAWTAPKTYRARSDAKRFESWERSVATQVGTAAALRYLVEQDIEVINRDIQALAHRLWSALDELPQTEMIDTRESLQSGLVLCHFPGVKKDPQVLMDQLYERGLNVFYSTVGGDQYHFRDRGIAWALRASVHYYNTAEEVDEAVKLIGELTHSARS